MAQQEPGSAWSFDGKILTVRIPMSFRRQGGRKRIVAPGDAAAIAPPPPRPDEAIVRAVVRAHRWRQMLDNGVYATLNDLARAEKINPSYLSRVMRLSLLAPDVIEAILDGRLREGVQVTDLLDPLPMDWEEQRTLLLPPVR